MNGTQLAGRIPAAAPATAVLDLPIGFPVNRQHLGAGQRRRNAD
jgi:hypothetical protein